MNSTHYSNADEHVVTKKVTVHACVTELRKRSERLVVAVADV